MADYKVVDGQQLDADLGTVADAIRERSGTTDPLTFPEGMVTAVRGIQDATKKTLYAVLDRSITEFVDDEITTLGSYAFSGSTALTLVSCANLTSTGNSFTNCKGLTTIDLPMLKSTGNNCFQSIAATIVDLPQLGFVNANLFKGAPNLIAVIFRRDDKVIGMNGLSPFEATPIASGTGYIYVPKTLNDGTDGVEAYKAATNWSAYADQIRAIEDYPEITGG